MQESDQNIAVVVTVVVFRYHNGELQFYSGVVPSSEHSLVQLPQAYVQKEESLEAAAFRAVGAFGLKINFLEQLYTFGLPNRRPGSRELSVSYLALSRPREEDTSSGWLSVESKPPFGSDFDKMLHLAIANLRQRFRHEPLAFELLPVKFPFSEVEHVYARVMSTDIDRRNFKKKFISSGILLELEEKLKRNVGRPAALFRFNSRKYFEIQKAGESLSLF